MIKCEVLRRFNNNDVGATVKAPSQAVADSWVADGLVKIIVAKATKAAPKDKVVRGSTDK